MRLLFFNFWFLEIFSCLIMSYYDNKFIFFKVILLLDVEIALDYFYFYCKNTIFPVYYIILEFISYYIYYTQLGHPYNIKKFLNKKLKRVN